MNWNIVLKDPHLVAVPTITEGDGDEGMVLISLGATLRNTPSTFLRVTFAGVAVMGPGNML